jgi:hypothetical protein
VILVVLDFIAASLHFAYMELLENRQLNRPPDMTALADF